MTTLLQRCITLDEKINSLALAKRHAADHRLIQQRAEEWGDQNQKLKALNLKANLLVFSTEDANVISSRRSALRKNAGTILERLQQDCDFKELTKDASWQRLLKAVEGMKDDLDASIRRAWCTYIDEQGILEDPSVLRQRTPRTPNNDINLEAYQASFSGYLATARLSSPRSEEDFSDIATHIAACRQAFSRITFDLPDDVKYFFEAINAGTATLAQVNNTVLEWIAENGQLEGFRVRASN